MFKRISKFVSLTMLIPFVISFFHQESKSYLEPVVELREGGSVQKRREIARVLELILRAINKHHSNRGDLNQIRNFFSTAGFDSITSMVNNDQIYACSATYRTNLVQFSNSNYFVVRGIKVWIDTPSNKIKQHRYLVFVFDQNEILIQVRYELDEHDYYDLFGAPDDTTLSLGRRKVITDFLETFRIAYNTKNIDTLRKIFSKKALVIVGFVPQINETKPGARVKSTVNEARLIEHPIDEYLKKLESVIFKNNSSIDVSFKKEKITQDSLYRDIFGVNLEQRWKSSYYNKSRDYEDSGYLFLLIDFRVPQSPKIHVRAWQQYPVEPKDRIDLDKFEIIS